MLTELYCFSISEKLFINKKIRRYSAPNFSLMIGELRENHDMSIEKIAFILQDSASAVFGWSTGAKPFYEHGENFVDLWKTLTEKSDEQIPRITRFY